MHSNFIVFIYSENTVIILLLNLVFLFDCNFIYYFRLLSILQFLHHGSKRTGNLSILYVTTILSWTLVRPRRSSSGDPKKWNTPFYTFMKRDSRWTSDSWVSTLFKGSFSSRSLKWLDSPLSFWQTFIQQPHKGLSVWVQRCGTEAALHQTGST